MSLYDLEVQTLSGETTTLRQLTAGTAALVVNVASKCGQTPQYAELEQLHEELPGLTVVGVPCNQFGEQEPGTPEEIAKFCATTYGVTFPMLAKVDVNGPDRAPLFEELTAVPDETGAAGDVKWNFEKWLLSPDGEVVGRFGPLTRPTDPALRAAVQEVVPSSD